MNPLTKMGILEGQARFGMGKVEIKSLFLGIPW